MSTKHQFQFEHRYGFELHINLQQQLLLSSIQKLFVYLDILCDEKAEEVGSWEQNDTRIKLEINLIVEYLKDNFNYIENSDRNHNRDIETLTYLLVFIVLGLTGILYAINPKQYNPLEVKRYVSNKMNSLQRNRFELIVRKAEEIARVLKESDKDSPLSITVFYILSDVIDLMPTLGYPFSLVRSLRSKLLSYSRKLFFDIPDSEA